MAISRRTFVTTTAASTVFASFTIAGTKASGKVLGANDTVRLGVAGIRGRGREHIEAFSKVPGVQITYLIDPDTKEHGSRGKMVESLYKVTPKAVQDIRKALEDKELDAISVATPNHWHTLLSVWAIQAGKDVYVEKPLSHNIREGRILVETAKKHKAIVQHGTQSRGAPGHQNRAAAIAEGKLGKLLVSRGMCYKPRKSIGMKAVQTPPDSIDFNIWLGPAQEQGYHGNIVHYNWHWFWDFGNGDIGNQGVHEMDIARWMIPGATLPKSVISVGGRFGYKDQGQTPNTQIAVFDYGETQLIFEVRGLTTKGGVGNSQVFDDKASAGKKEVALHEGVKSPIAKRAAGGVFANFIDCVRSRKAEDLDANVLEGHLSSSLCHLANMSFRLGKEVSFDPSKKTFGTDDTFANETFEKMSDHLKDNGVELSDTKYILGRKLEVDAKTEMIVNDAEANALLTRAYRAPFVVPDKV